MVWCQRLLIACLLFRIIFPGDFAPLGMRTLYDTHGRQKTKVKSKDSRFFLIDFVPVLHHVTRVPSLSCTRNINLKNPTCYVMHHQFNPLNPELNSICYLLALLGAHHFLHVSRIRVKLLTFRRLISYIYIWSTHS